MIPDDRSRTNLYESIPPSSSDSLLRTWGYDLIDEYARVIQEACLPTGVPALELATGSGRMTAVLSRLGFNTITGDISDEKRQQALHRLTPDIVQAVQMILLDLEALPFRSGSVKITICVDTLHELEHPRDCLSELLRVQDPAGTLILGDFNENGFEVMQRLHRVTYKNDHPRGTLSVIDVEPLLRRTFSEVRMVVTPLNISYIASRKK